jgi:predicted DNA-binding transcriptional regulator YafY
VPEYLEMRTFAAERIETFGLPDELFDPRPLPTEPFADSLGVNSGTPDKVVIEFEPQAAVHVRTRTWHKSQKFEELADGRLRLTMKVCNDHALRAWVLGFGADAFVCAPESLARDVADTADATRRRYPRQSRTDFRMLEMKVG